MTDKRGVAATQSLYPNFTGLFFMKFLHPFLPKQVTTDLSVLTVFQGGSWKDTTYSIY